MTSRVHEDYVRAMWSAREWNGTPATISDLAARFGTTRATASANIRALVQAGLALHERYGTPALTPAGERLALRMVRRHRILESWLVTLGFGLDELDEQVETLEHGATDALIERLAVSLGNPDADPHGDPIPGPDGEVDYPEGHQAGRHQGAHVVVRVDDDAPGLLGKLAEAGIGPGSSVMVTIKDAGVALTRGRSTAGLTGDECDAVILACE